jgi:hypothetical protein
LKTEVPRVEGPRVASIRTNGYVAGSTEPGCSVWVPAVFGMLVRTSYDDFIRQNYTPAEKTLK